MPCLYRLAGQIWSGVQQNQSLELHSAMRLSEAKIQHIVPFQIMPTVKSRCLRTREIERIGKQSPSTSGIHLKKNPDESKKITSSSQTILETLKGDLNEQMVSSVCRVLKKLCNLKTSLNHRRSILIYDLSEYEL